MSDFAELPAWELKYVYELMYNKFIQLNKIKYPATKSFPTVLSQVFGATKIKGDTSTEKSFDTLTDLINDDNKVKAYLARFPMKKIKGELFTQSIPFGTIYAEIVEAFKEKNDNVLIKLTGKTAIVFFLFLGYDDLVDFRKKCFKQVKYLGYFFSQNQDKVMNFTLALDIPNTDETTIKENSSNKTSAIYNATLIGFYSGKPEATLSGKLTAFQQCWTARLENSEYFLDLNIHMGGDVEKNIQVLNKYKQLHCSISGTGSKNYLYCGECVLIKEEYAKEDLVLETKRFLNLRRARFSVDVGNMLSPEKLSFTINGHPLKTIKHLSNKTYRILTASPDGLFIQSKFTIHEDYRGEIIVPVRINKNSMKFKERTIICGLSFFNIAEDRLLIFAYKDQYVLYSTTVIEIPSETTLEKGQEIIIDGAFCVTDHEANLSPIGNIFVMTIDASAFSPIIFHNDDKAFIEDDVIKVLSNSLKNNINKWIEAWKGK